MVETKNSPASALDECDYGHLDLVIIIPCYEDWGALQRLLPDLDQTLRTLELQGLVVVVNDGGSPPPDGFPTDPNQMRLGFELVTLRRNLGHQRAIAIGLAHIADNHSARHIVVMDADGEDDPHHIADLLAASAKHPNRIVFAQRSRRSESLPFRVGYALFKWLFRVLSGQSVTFGNFSLLPNDYLLRLASTPEIWTHFAAGILRARLPYTTVPLARAKRYTGQSRMNPASLVLHGLAAISLYADVAAVRVLIFTSLMSAAGLLTIGAVTAIRLFTDLATPGWATSAVAGAAMLMVQAISLSLLLVFVGFQQRSTMAALPSAVYREYIESVTRVDATPADILAMPSDTE